MSQRESNVRSRWLVWGGRVVSALPVLMLLASGGMKLSRSPELVKQFVEVLGYRESTLPGIGVIELVCVLLYAIPRTSVLGAVLLTGYLGGAIATHVRIGDPFASPLLIAVLVWAGLFLRDDRVRALLSPWRARAAASVGQGA